MLTLKRRKDVVAYVLKVVKRVERNAKQNLTITKSLKLKTRLGRNINSNSF